MRQYEISKVCSGNYSAGQPLVSILMPAYNHERFVKQAVESVWNQTYKNIELIVIDDGSSDKTFEILQALNVISPISMKIYTQQNQGICRTLNRCFELSHGEWIAFLASDDQYINNFIERMLVESNKHPKDSTVFHCDAVGINEQGISGARLSKIRKIPPLTGNVFYKALHNEGFIVSSTAFFSRCLHEKVGIYDSRLRAEDFDMFLRLARIAQFVYIDEPLFLSRRVQGNLGSRTRVWASDIFLALEKHKDFLMNDYQGIIVNFHKKLALKFFSECDFKYALHYLFNAIKLENGISKSIVLLEVLFAFICEIPRIFIFSVFSNSFINHMRNLKHKFIINR